MRYLSSALLPVALALAGPATAQSGTEAMWVLRHSDTLFDTGTNFLNGCQLTDNVIRIACNSYIQGVYEASRTEAELKKTCVPDGAQRGQLLEVALKFVRDYPSEAHRPPAVIAIYSWRQAWPCPGSKD